MRKIRNRTPVCFAADLKFFRRNEHCRNNTAADQHHAHNQRRAA